MDVRWCLWGRGWGSIITLDRLLAHPGELFLLDTSEDWRLATECTLILQDKGTLATKLGSHPEEL